MQEPSRQLSLSTEKSLKEHGDKVSAEDKKAIENGVSELKKSLKVRMLKTLRKNSKSSSSVYEIRRSSI